MKKVYSVSDFASTSEEAAAANAWWIGLLHSIQTSDIRRYCHILSWDSFTVLAKYREAMKND